MDQTTETAIKAIVLGLYRSKAIGPRQLAAVVDELSFAATDLATRDAEASARIEGMAEWFKQATESDGKITNGRLSRF